jgi:hypothetical protein
MFSTSLVISYILGLNLHQQLKMGQYDPVHNLFTYRHITGKPIWPCLLKDKCKGSCLLIKPAG